MLLNLQEQEKLLGDGFEFDGNFSKIIVFVSIIIFQQGFLA